MSELERPLSSGDCCTAFHVMSPCVALLRTVRFGLRPPIFFAHSSFTHCTMLPRKLRCGCISWEFAFGSGKRTPMKRKCPHAQFAFGSACSPGNYTQTRSLRRFVGAGMGRGGSVWVWRSSFVALCAEPAGPAQRRWTINKGDLSKPLPRGRRACKQASQHHGSRPTAMSTRQD